MAPPVGAAAEPPLPPGWRATTSKTSGTAIYVHDDGRKTRTRPVAADASGAAAGAAAAPVVPAAVAVAAAVAAPAVAVDAEVAAVLPLGWRRVVSKSSGTVFYAHDDGRKQRHLPT